MFGKENLEFLLNQIEVDINEIRKKISNRNLTSLDLIMLTNNLTDLSNRLVSINITNVKIVEQTKRIMHTSSSLCDYLNSAGLFSVEVNNLQSSIRSLKSTTNVGTVINVTGKAGGFISKLVKKRVEKNVSSFGKDIKSIFGK